MKCDYDYLGLLSSNDAKGMNTTEVPVISIVLSVSQRKKQIHKNEKVIADNKKPHHFKAKITSDNDECTYTVHTLTMYLLTLMSGLTRHYTRN